MAVQFSLSYDANGDPVLVENTVTGTRKVVSTSPVVSEYKSRFETPASEDTNTDTDTDTSDGGSDIYRYINEMENNADNDMNLSFVDKQNLGRYTPEAIEARNKPKTRTQSVMETIALAMLPYGKAAISVVKALDKILPQESEEIRAIKQFYATPEMSTLVESIPGMKNYNLVYGGFPGISDPSYGLAGVARKRQDTILGTLSSKYGMSDPDIAAIKAGTYTGITPINPATGKPTKLIDRYNNLGEISDRETGEITRIKEQRAKDLGDMRGGVGRDSDPAPSPPVSTAGQATPFDRKGGGQDSGNQGGNGVGSSTGGGASPGSTGPGGSDEMGSF